MANRNSAVTIEQQECAFPARALRAYRQELVAAVAALENAGAADHGTTRPYAQVLLSIDRLGLDHGNVSGCDCWHPSWAPASRVR